MVHPQIRAFTEKFEREISSTFEHFPIFKLDHSWPSVGTVDLLLFHLRGREELSDQEISLLQGCAAYLGIILHDVWSQFDDGSEVNFTLSDERESEFMLTLRGGQFLGPDEVVSISMSATVSAILRELPNPLPVFESYRMQASPFENLLSPVVAGIASTLTPYADGSLATKRIYEITSYVLTAQRALSESTARFFQNLFSAEQILHDPALYLSNLIFPPSGYDEKYPGSRAAVALVDYMLQSELTDQQMERMAFALANCPDALISAAGFSVLAALCKGTPSPSLVVLSESKRVPIHRLRPAVIAARRSLGLPHDWLVLLEDGQLGEAMELVQIEQKLGMLPLLQCPTGALSDPRMRDMLHAVAWGELQHGAAAAAHVLQDQQFDPNVALQAIQFDIAQGHFDGAESGLKTLASSPDPNGEVVHRANRMLAQCAIYRKQWGAARDYLLGALEPDTITRSDRVATLNELGYMYLLLDEPQLCLEAVSESLTLEPYHLPQRLNRIAALQMKGEEDAALQEIEAITRYNATDPRIFELIRTQICPRVAPPLQ